jgi:hypothetical protein
MQSDIEALEKVVEWLDGLTLGHVTDRLHKYVSNVRQQLPLPTNVSEAAEMGFIFLEAREFVNVCTAYKGAETPALIAKLRKVLKGSWTLSQESSKNSDARNTMFELSLAAELKLRGIDVELGEPDLLITLPEGQYVVECKRPFKEMSVRANVKGAESQLRANLKPGQHGVIAVSLSRIVNPGNAMLGVNVGDLEAQGAVHGNLQADLHGRCRLLMRDLSGLSFSPNIAALMFDIYTPFITEKGEGLARGCRIYPTDEPKFIQGKLAASRNPSSAFTYFDRAIGQVLENDLSPEAHAVSDLIDLKSQLPPGIGVMISKSRKDPSPLGLIVPVDFRARK